MKRNNGWSPPFAGMILLSLLCMPMKGDEQNPGATSPEASRLLAEVVREYRNSPAYEDSGELQVEYVAVPKKGEGKTSRVSVKAQLAFARPNLLALSLGSLRLFCDGKDMTVVIDSTHRYFVAPAPSKITLDTFRKRGLRDLVVRDWSSEHLAYLITLLLGEDLRSPIPTPVSGGWELGPDELIGGKKCKCLCPLQTKGDRQLTFGLGNINTKLFVDSETKRLLCLENTFEVPLFLFSPLPSPPVELPPGVEGVVGDALPFATAMLPRRIKWVAGGISSAKPAASMFNFQAPQDYTRVDAFEKLLEFDPQALAPVRF